MTSSEAEEVPVREGGGGPRQGRGGLGWLLALGAALLVYGFTMAPDLVWHDAGYYQWEAARLNFMRPGEAVRVHPFFLVVAHGLGQLGIWNYAKAASVASALGTAVSVANVWLIVWLLTRKRGPASIAALACMLAHTIWQVGVQPQTYGWSNAALSGMLLAAVAYALRGRVAYLLLAFFVGGVGISIHVMSQIGLAALGVWGMVRVLRGRTPAWVLPAGAGLWLVGGALFWYVAFLEYQRTRDVAATLQSAFLGGWGAAVFNVSSLGTMLGRSALMAVLNFPTPAALLGLYGIWRSRRLLAGTPLAAVLGGVMLLYVLFAVRYRIPNQNHFFTPAYLLFAVYIGLGAHAALPPKGRVEFFAAVLLVVLVVPAYMGITEAARFFKYNPRESGAIHKMPHRDFYAYYFLPWQCNQTGAREFADEVMESLPQGALMLPDSTSAPPLKCVHDVEGRRPDVQIVDPYDARFDPALGDYWYAEEPPADLLRGERPVFTTSNSPQYLPRWFGGGCAIRPYGCIWEVKPGAAPKPRPKLKAGAP